MVKSDKKPHGHVHIPHLSDVDTSAKFQNYLLDMKLDGGILTEVMEEYIKAGIVEVPPEDTWSSETSVNLKLIWTSTFQKALILTFFLREENRERVA